MRKGLFRSLIAALAVGTGLTLFVTSFASSIASVGASAVPQSPVETGNAWTHQVDPVGDDAWRNFAQHAPESYLQVGVGNFIDTFPVFNFGRNPDVNGIEDIWSVGGDFIFPTTAEPLQLVSTSIEDNPTGTGAHTVLVIGLDANYQPIDEIVILNGLTPVLTSNSFLRVNRAVVDDAGASSSNVGSVGAEQQTSTLPLFLIPPEKGQAPNIAYTVPDNFSLLITRIYGNVIRQPTTPSTNATLELIIRPYGKAARTVGYAGLSTLGTNWSSQLYPVPAKISERTDIKMRVEASATGSDVNAGYEAYLVSNQ